MYKATAYYNEIDPYTAEWLRNLIVLGEIAYGIVDTRSIEDVEPSDLRGFTQCHFFAGIGVWSYALRRAGWPDDRPVWTASCPCQPFSEIGKGAGFADERHLWPSFYHLVCERRPGVVLGEQVASEDGLAWLDVVHADMEAAGYAFGATDICAAGVGAPHIRQRLCFVGRLGDADSARLEGHTWHVNLSKGWQDAVGSTATPGRVNGYWANAEWIGPDTTGKFRPIEPGVKPLVDGSPQNMGLLRAYGNAIVGPLLQEFIDAYLDFEALGTLA